jgi:hypothetical protein
MAHAIVCVDVGENRVALLSAGSESSSMGTTAGFDSSSIGTTGLVADTEQSIMVLVKSGL